MQGSRTSVSCKMEGSFKWEFPQPQCPCSGPATCSMLEWTFVAGLETSPSLWSGSPRLSFLWFLPHFSVILGALADAVRYASLGIARERRAPASVHASPWAVSSSPLGHGEFVAIFTLFDDEQGYWCFGWYGFLHRVPGLSQPNHHRRRVRGGSLT